MKIGYLMQEGVPDVRARPLSGPAAHVAHVIRALADLGHEVVLLANLDGRPSVSHDLSHFRAVSVPAIDRGPLRLLERGIRRCQRTLGLPYAAFWDSLRFALACRQELAGCHLFYERMGWVGYGGSLAAGWLGVPHVLEVNGDHLDELTALGIAPRGLQRTLSTWLMGRTARRAAMAVATGEGWRRRHVARWGVATSRTVVIENGSEAVELLEQEQLRAFGPATPGTETTLIYVGGFEPWHGLSVLLDALANARTRQPGLRLVLVGQGSQLSTLLQQIHDHGLSEIVEVTGPLGMREVSARLARADIGLSPYCGRVEHSGLKLLDYKAAGLATIASGEDGQPAVLRHRETGWIVPPCHPEALADAIVALSADAALRRAMGRQARLEAEQQHRWRHTGEQLESLFRRVLDSTEGTAAAPQTAKM